MQQRQRQRSPWDSLASHRLSERPGLTEDREQQRIISNPDLWPPYTHRHVHPCAHQNKTITWAREMARQFRALAVLREDPGGVPSTISRGSQPPPPSVPRDPTSSCILISTYVCSYPHMCTHIHMSTYPNGDIYDLSSVRTHTYTHLKIKIKRTRAGVVAACL